MISILLLTENRQVYFDEVVEITADSDQCCGHNRRINNAQQKSHTQTVFALHFQFFHAYSVQCLPELHKDQAHSVQSFRLRRLSRLVQGIVPGWCLWTRFIILTSGGSRGEPLPSIFWPWACELGS